jgi:type III pantothenate kinase
MILAVDAGNSRIKWGLHDGHTWIVHGASGHDELDGLEAAWRGLPAPERIAVANVAGESVRAAIDRYAAQWHAPLLWLKSSASACGVVNGYETPHELGVDRWAAAVAAYALHPGDCVVVILGTATTINLVDARGLFRGGMILPGLALMKQSLHAHTAALPLAAGRYRDEPRNTADAIESGCLAAQAGAIERLHAQLAPEAICFITGGAAKALMPLLRIPVRHVEHLVLEGVRRLAAQEAAP